MGKTSGANPEEGAGGIEMQQRHNMQAGSTARVCFYCYWSGEMHVHSKQYAILNILLITSPIIRVT